MDYHRPVPHIRHPLPRRFSTLVGPPGSGQCANALERSLAICSWLGIPIALENVEGPSTTLTFLGIELDSLSWEAQLTKEKLFRIHSMVQEWSGRKSCKHKELESLLGYLQDAARVVHAGKTFTRRIIGLLHLPSMAFLHVCLNCGFCSDIEWWCQFLLLEWCHLSSSHKIYPTYYSHLGCLRQLGLWGLLFI